MKKLYLLSIFIINVGIIFPQLTTNLLDNFNRTDNTTVGSTPTSPKSLTWNESETIQDGLQISSDKLIAGSTTSGREWCYVDMSSVTNYPLLLNDATGIITWAINMKSSRSNPSGFGSGSYGIAFILATSTSNDVTTGNGYAVVLGGTGSPDDIRFSRFNNGINSSSNFIDLITSTANLTGNEYLSIKVTYNPSGNNWSLYVESNSSSYPQSDPRNTSVQIGLTTSNSTYANITLNYLGVLWNHGIASESAEFDNIYVSDPGGALPVELSSFTSKIIGNKVNLSWQTATEVNNYGFEIERSAYRRELLAESRFAEGELNADSWTKIGFVKGSGNSNSPKDYSFVDNKLTQPGAYYYRLKQIDNDGKFSYSKTISIDYNKTLVFGLEQNYPNPFNPVTTIKFTLPEASHVLLKLYDALGQEIKTLLNENRQAGIHSISFIAGNLCNGVYYYRITAGNYSSVKKMLILK